MSVINCHFLNPKLIIVRQQTFLAATKLKILKFFSILISWSEFSDNLDRKNRQLVFKVMLSSLTKKNSDWSKIFVVAFALRGCWCSFDLKEQVHHFVALYKCWFCLLKAPTEPIKDLAVNCKDSTFLIQHIFLKKKKVTIHKNAEYMKNFIRLFPF